MVSKIRELCKQNKTSIAALERQLGFGNGVIGRWDKSVPNYDRLCAVANALGVSVAELTGGTDPDTKKDTAQLSDDDETTKALLDFARNGPQAQKEDVLQYIQFLMSKRNSRD